MATTEQKVISYLVNRNQKELKSIMMKLVGITWEEHHQPIIDLCNQYTKISKPDYKMTDLVINEFKNKTYLAKILELDSGLISGIGEINIEKLIRTQEEIIVKNKIQDLKGKNVNETLAELKNIKGISPKKPLNLKEVKKRRLVDRAYEKVAPSTGYKKLDAILKGFVPGRVYTMTGETNVGKTTIACNFAYRVAKQGKRVLYFSLEPDITVIEYLASIWNAKRFDELSEKDLDAPKDVEIDIYTKEDVNSLEDMVQIVENSPRYDLIIIDHFGYFISDSKNSVQAEKNAMKIMASFSKRNKTAVFIVVHPRKPAPGRKVRKMTIHDISGSAAFSQDATDVLIVARQLDEDDPFGIKYTDEGWLAVHKTKSGGNGAMKIYFKEKSALILEKKIFSDIIVGSL